MINYHRKVSRNPWRSTQNIPDSSQHSFTQLFLALDTESYQKNHMALIPSSGGTCPPGAWTIRFRYDLVAFSPPVHTETMKMIMKTQTKLDLFEKARI